MYAQCTEMACPPVCEEGASILSEDGCNTCTCTCQGDGQHCEYGCTKRLCPERDACPSLSCSEGCEFGFRSDLDGCPSCECLSPVDFCARVRCAQPECGDNQRVVKAGCCEVCEDIELAGAERYDGCTLEGLANGEGTMARGENT